MGCCEYKSIQSEFLMVPESNLDKRKSSFNDISIYSDNEDNNKCSMTSPQNEVYLNTSYNNLEVAFLMRSMAIPKVQNALLTSICE